DALEDQSVRLGRRLLFAASRQDQPCGYERNKRTQHAHSGVRVSASTQFGSRERVSRTNVQMSVTSSTTFALPEMTWPSSSRVTFTCSETNLTVTRASRSSSSASTISADFMPTRVESN